MAVATERVFRYWDYPLFGLLTMLNLGTTGFVLHYWFAEAGPSHPVLFALLTVPLLLVLGAYEVRWLTLPLMLRPLPMEPSPGAKVGVATTFVPGLESIEMLEETLCALVSMQYPHETWVLDEGDSPEVKALCRRLGVRHFSRKDRSSYQTESGIFAARTKHGNYNAWLTEFGYSAYDIIVAFDPDHVPHRRFLLEVLGYFDDPRIGYVQAPHFYHN
ncbi:MAG: glycosyltransferase, partial [Actinobacteria bacterium]|nr:glycosyltransferase [Actinomycetota bacterium]